MVEIAGEGWFEGKKEGKVRRVKKLNARGPRGWTKRSKRQEKVRRRERKRERGGWSGVRGVLIGIR